MNNDSISRKMAIKAFDDLPNCYNGYSDTYDKAYIIEVLEELPSVEKHGRWIPTWQELPQDNRFVLVCNDDERIAVAQYIGHEIDSYHPWQIAYCPYDVDIWEDSEHGKIMAWMELPKPYREGEKDDKEGSTDVFERLRKRILR